LGATVAQGTSFLTGHIHANSEFLGLNIPLWCVRIRHWGPSVATLFWLYFIIDRAKSFGLIKSHNQTPIKILEMKHEKMKSHLLYLTIFVYKIFLIHFNWCPIMVRILSRNMQHEKIKYIQIYCCNGRPSLSLILHLSFVAVVMKFSNFYSYFKQTPSDKFHKWVIYWREIVSFIISICVYN